MSPETRRYLSFLLRLWQARSAGDGETVWQGSLEDSRTHERRGFSSLDALMKILCRKTQEAEEDERNGGERT